MPDNETSLLLLYKGLVDTTNAAFCPLYENKSRYLVLMGGGGSGKSVFAGRKIIERAAAEPGHRFLVCRKIMRTIKESCISQLLWQLERRGGGGWTYMKTDPAIRFDNGSEILFVGLDDVEKLKSIHGITGLWLEEASELTEGDFNQLDVRLRGESRYYKQMILTFNPVSALHWLKRRFFDAPDPRATVHHSTYRDNRFLDSESIATLEGFKDTDEYFYSVYCLGEWGTTGRSVFGSGAVYKRLSQAPEPSVTGAFHWEDDGLKLSSIRFIPEGSLIQVFSPPETGAPYVIGCDTAGGGSDFFCAQVLDNRTGRQVCTLRGRMDEDVFARQLYCLGVWYNNALIAVECNLSTYPTMELGRLGYFNQYVRETVDDYTQRPTRSFGFVTNQRTRPLILSELIKACREGMELINDKNTLREMLTFVRGKDYRPQAENGAHDDCVMALAIAHFIRPRQSYTTPPRIPDASHWTEDMREDYQNASPADRAYLLEKWGE